MLKSFFSDIHYTKSPIVCTQRRPWIEGWRAGRGKTAHYTVQLTLDLFIKRQLLQVSALIAFLGSVVSQMGFPLRVSLLPQGTRRWLRKLALGCKECCCCWFHQSSEFFFWLYLVFSVAPLCSPFCAGAHSSGKPVLHVWSPTVAEISMSILASLSSVLVSTCNLWSNVTGGNRWFTTTPSTLLQNFYWNSSK